MRLFIPHPDGGVICGGGKERHIKNKGNNVDDSTLLKQARSYLNWSCKRTSSAGENAALL